MTDEAQDQPETDSLTQNQPHFQTSPQDPNQARPRTQGSDSAASVGPEPQFPSSDHSRVWFITAGNSPIGIEAARKLLAHGDSVVAGVLPAEFDARSPRSRDFRAFLDDVYREKSVAERLRVVEFDVRSIGECQSAVADAISVFDRIDVLFCCNSEALLGTVEELSQSARAQALVKDQFATNFFGPVNIIKAALPSLRAQKHGHVVLLTGITGHLGTPGLGMYCASQWAIEGYADSLAYEIAPFNIKLSIVQNSLEIGVLTNRITAVPPLSAYEMPNNPAPFPRRTLAGLLDQLDMSNARESMDTATSDSTAIPNLEQSDSNGDSSTASNDPELNQASQDTPNAQDEPKLQDSSSSRNLDPTSSNPTRNQNTSTSASTSTSKSNSTSKPPSSNPPEKTERRNAGSYLVSPTTSSLYPPLPQQFQQSLIAETVHAILAIGGHENPPARHIVGHEGVASVKEKLKTVSEELEDFVDVSLSVDI